MKRIQSFNQILYTPLAEVNQAILSLVVLDTNGFLFNNKQTQQHILPHW